MYTSIRIYIKFASATVISPFSCLIVISVVDNTTTWLSLRMIVFILFLMKCTAATNTAGPNVSLQWINETCIGGDHGLLSTGLRLTLNASNETGLCYFNTTWIKYNSPLPDLGRYCKNCSGSISNVTIEFEQPEHGGGACHCVQIDFHNPNGTFRLVISVVINLVS